MKKGEQVYCLKSQYDQIGNIVVQKGCWYTIDDITEMYISLCGINNKKIFFDINFCQNHFCDTKELRRRKLKRIHYLDTFRPTTIFIKKS